MGSIWDGENETRLLEVTPAFAVQVHDSNMFLSQISLREGKLFTCYTDKSFHGHLKVISLEDGRELSHHVFTFSLNNFIHKDTSAFILYSYRKVYYIEMERSLPQAPRKITKEAKFIAVSPFCSYTLCSKGKFSAIVQMDKAMHVHFNVLQKAKNCSETLVPFKPDCTLETGGSVSTIMLSEMSLDTQGPTLVTLDNHGTVRQRRWNYTFASNFSHREEK